MQHAVFQGLQNNGLLRLCAGHRLHNTAHAATPRQSSRGDHARLARLTSSGSRQVLHE